MALPADASICPPTGYNRVPVPKRERPCAFTGTPVGVHAFVHARADPVLLNRWGDAVVCDVRCVRGYMCAMDEVH
jgi:hypothetical protein